MRNQLPAWEKFAKEIIWQQIGKNEIIKAAISEQYALVRRHLY